MIDKLLYAKWARNHRLSERCALRHRVVNYDPGHVRYQLGHYPCSEPHFPDETDWHLLDLYEQNGVGVVHVWQWQDWMNLFGKGVHRPMHEPALRRFIDECHRRKLKVIPYMSPGFLDIRDPAYRAEWGSGTPHLRELFYDLDRMCPGSPGWRLYFGDALNRFLDDYGFDGVYWDTGFSIGCSNADHDNHVHFVEHAPYAEGKDAKGMDHAQEARYIEELSHQGCWDLWNEFLSEIYSKVKRRNGLIVAHIGTDRSSPFADKLWDYLLLGECVGDLVESLERTRWYEPYVLRFNDWSRLVTNWEEKDFTPQFDKVADVEHRCMAASIPYLQFEWLEDGNFGRREDMFSLPNVKWKEEYDIWTEWAKAQEKAGLDPILNASFIAGRDRYFDYLRVYRRLAVDNTVAYVEVKDIESCPFPQSTATRKVSVFVNDCLWVALANLSDVAETVKVGPLDADKDRGMDVTIPAERLVVLRYTALDRLPEMIEFKE